MSISFREDMGPEAQNMIKKLFDAEVMDEKTALLKNMERQFTQQQMKELANTAKQPVALEMNKIGDRKEVGGVVYELGEKGWRRLPIGTKL